MPARSSADVVSAVDLAACRALMRGGSRSFFAAARLLPRDVRASASALYAFCRLADDAVDLAEDTAGAIDALCERLLSIHAGSPGDHPADRAFAAVVARHHIPPALPRALIEGFEWDLEGRRYETLEDLCDYAARVAGTVGAMMCLIMGERSAHALTRACELGVAMQLTNIARDVGEDARMGRLYLPRAWMREAGIDPDAWLARPVFDAALGSVVARLLATAEMLYMRAESGIAELPSACRPAIMAARLIYAGIGGEIARNGHDSVNARAVVGGWRKLGLAAFALTSTKTGILRPDRGEAPLACNTFLVGAVMVADHSAGRKAPAPRLRQNGLGGVAWVLDLFLRLSARDRANAIYGRLPAR
jgi:phytoene synthase